MFRIKICGITNVEDAIAAVDACADAIGLNFYEKSPRCVTIEAAAQAAKLAHDRLVTPVGVFVNHSPPEVHRIAADVGLSVFQLHGDETPEIAKEIFDNEWEIIRVHRYRSEDGIYALQHDLLHYTSVVGYGPSAYLVDAASSGAYGGTGTVLPWTELADYPKAIGTFELILAGGLTPDNVAEAIRIVRPAAVDVASGVESAPGKKDPVKVRDFVAAAKAAFESLES